MRLTNAQRDGMDQLKKAEKAGDISQDEQHTRSDDIQQTTDDHIKDIDDMPESLLNQISHFFEHYKDLEKGKWVKIDGWGNSDEAKAEIVSSIERFNAAPEKPHF